MSDDETEEESPEEPPEERADGAEASEGEDDRPAIEEDERADVDALREKVSEVSDEVAEEDGLEADDGGDSDDSSDADENAGDGGEDSAPSTGGEDETVGDMYAGVVGVLAIAIAEELGDGETDQEAEDIAAMLRGERGMPFNVASSVDQLLEESGHGTDLPPGKAVVVGTVAAVGMVLLQETDLANNLVSELLSGDL